MQHRHLTRLRVSLALSFACLAIPATAAALIAAPSGGHRWLFDEDDGVAAYDDFGTADGTLGSSATRIQGPFGTGAISITPTGIYDTNGYVDFGNSAGAFGTADFTVAHWYKTTFAGSGKHGDVIGNRVAGSSGNFFSVRLVGDGALVVELQDGSGGNSLTAVGAPSYGLNDGQWHHLAYVRSGAAFTLYIDGAVADTRVTGSGQPTSINGGSSFRIGRRLPAAYSNFHTIPASYEDVRIFDRALDDTEIQDVVSGSL
jgi:hypothetical protein